MATLVVERVILCGVVGVTPPCPVVSPAVMSQCWYILQIAQADDVMDDVHLPDVVTLLQPVQDGLELS